MNDSIGYGKLKEIDGKYQYDGTIPNLEENENEIAILPKKFLEELIKAETLLLLKSKSYMSEKLYEKHSLTFPDEINYVAKDNTRHRLFLDRHMYTNNPKDMIFIRYVSVDQSFIEEGM